MAAKVSWIPAPDVKRRLNLILKVAGVTYIKSPRLFCVRSRGAKTRAQARIWGLGRIWQESLKTAPAYIIEVIAEKFDRLAAAEQDRVLIHEILHIPKNFSGALLPHYGRGVNEVKVAQLFATLKTSTLKK